MKIYLRRLPASNNSSIIIMNYSFIQIKPRESFLTMIDANKTPRYMCFSNKLDALHCITYVSKFRSKNGYFPFMDLSQEKELIEIKEDFKKRKPQEISKFLSIETLSDSEVDRLCSKTNIKLFCVHSFSFQTNMDQQMKVLLSAQAMDSVPNFEKYVENLNNYL